MIQQFVERLIENVPLEANKEPIRIDLILEGGAFNGSYLIGALYFLKEMEKRKMIKIERISGASIGSILGFLYFIDALDLSPSLYEILLNDFKKKHNLSIIKNLRNYINEKIPNNITCQIENKFFISYINVNKCKKIVKSTYKNVDDIINTIIKSCFIPFFIDNSLCYKNKYIDGVTPHIFDLEKEKKILFLDLMSADKIFNIINLKNEKSNLHRVLTGLLDIHIFFIKKRKTHFCSYVNDWNFYDIINNLSKKVFEKVVTYVVYFVICIRKVLPRELEKSSLYKSLSKQTYKYYTSLIERNFT
jgi:hypothetical protein